jgi:hypothetical protein
MQLKSGVRLLSAKNRESTVCSWSATRTIPDLQRAFQKNGGIPENEINVDGSWNRDIGLRFNRKSTHNGAIACASRSY